MSILMCCATNQRWIKLNDVSYIWPLQYHTLLLVDSSYSKTWEFPIRNAVLTVTTSVCPTSDRHTTSVFYTWPSPNLVSYTWPSHRLSALYLTIIKPCALHLTFRSAQCLIYTWASPNLVPSVWPSHHLSALYLPLTKPCAVSLTFTSPCALHLTFISPQCSIPDPHQTLCPKPDLHKTLCTKPDLHITPVLYTWPSPNLVPSVWPSHHLVPYTWPSHHIVLYTWANTFVPYAWLWRDLCLVAGDLGGYLGLLLGASVVTVCEFLDLLIFNAIGMFKKRRRIEQIPITVMSKGQKLNWE